MSCDKGQVTGAVLTVGKWLIILQPDYKWRLSFHLQAPVCSANGQTQLCKGRLALDVNALKTEGAPGKVASGLPEAGTSVLDEGLAQRSQSVLAGHIIFLTLCRGLKEFTSIQEFSRSFPAHLSLQPFSQPPDHSYFLIF